MSIGLTPTFLAGQWNAVCDRCGASFKSGELRKTWQGWMCCARCWEPRHPQDFVRASKDSMTPPWTRPVSGLPTNLIMAPASYGGGPTGVISSDSSALAGVAIAGVAIAGSSS